MQSRSVWKGIIFLTVTQLLIRHVLSAPTCGSSQKQRTDTNGLPICCYTTRCNKSQQFEFCTSDQGYDSCNDCPLGTYTEDTINTGDWNTKHDVCVTLPHCNPEEIMVGYTCLCALGKGYYGPRDNCILDSNCKGAGFQLQNDGSCVACDSEHYKPEDGTHGICRNKSRCNVDEMEASPGTLTTDRTCVKVNVTTTSTQSTTAVPVPGGNTPEGGLAPGVIAVIVIVCVGVLVAVVLLYVFCIHGRRRRVRLQELHTGNFQLSNLLNRCRLRNRTAGGNQGPEHRPMITPSDVVIPNGTHVNGSLSENGSPVNHPATGNEDMVDGHSYQTDSAIKDDILAELISGSDSLMSDSNESVTIVLSQTTSIPKIVADGNDNIDLPKDQFPPLSDSLFLEESDNVSSMSFSSIEQREDAPCTSDLELTEEKSKYFTCQSAGNIPDQLFESLETSPNTETTTIYTADDSPVESQVNDKCVLKKIVPMAAVPPTIRSEARGNTGQCPNASTVSVVSPDGTSSTDRSDTDRYQGFPASSTTASGLDVEQATIVGNDKLVANAPYGELQADMRGRCQNDETSASADTEEAHNYVIESETTPVMRHLPASNTTFSGQLLMSPESDGSYDHSTNDSSDPQIVDRESTENNQPDLDRENMQ